MPFPCSKCQKELSVWDLHRIIKHTHDFLGHKIKLDRDICTECLGWGENIHSKEVCHAPQKT